MSKIRLAFIATGGIMNHHAKQFAKMEEVEVVALCDTNRESAEVFREKYYSEDVPIFTDPGEVYTTVGPDAVTIATPHTLHHGHCVQALEAGCHVLIEKPMVTSLADAIDLEKRVNDSGKILTIGYNSVCTPVFARLRAIRESDEFGPLQTVTINQSQGWMRGTTGKWRQNPALSGGGMLYDSGAHVLNALTWTVNCDVESVFAYVDNRGCPVDINGVICVKFTDGTLASVGISGNSATGNHAVFNFERLRADLDAWGGTWMKLKEQASYKEPAKPEEQVSGEGVTPMQNFVDAILGRAEPVTTARHGVIQSQLMDCIYASAEQGRPVSPSELD